MAKVLITGRAGSGKTTVANELLKRGYTAFDADKVPSLSTWVNSKTGEAVTLADTTTVDTELYDWVWRPTQLENLTRQYVDFFLCGGADNDFSFDDLFDYHFVLDVSPDIQAERVKNRTNNDYGKGMIAYVLKDQAEHIAQAQLRQSIIIDADQPVEQVVDKVIEKLAEYDRQLTNENL